MIDKREILEAASSFSLLPNITSVRLTTGEHVGTYYEIRR
jgi:hypothetical protein